DTAENSRYSTKYAAQYFHARGIVIFFKIYTFQASHIWQRRFLRAHKLSFRARTHQGQVAEATANADAAKFAEEVKTYVKDHQITNVLLLHFAWRILEKDRAHRLVLASTCDVTSGTTGSTPACSVAFGTAVDRPGVAGKDGDTSGNEKERATAMVLADLRGQIYDLFVLFNVALSKVPATQQHNVEQQHGFGRRLWETMAPLQDSHRSQLYANRSGWWNAALTVQFLKYHFGSRDRSSEPILLLLDSFSGHWTDDVLATATSENVHLMTIPPNLTWRAEPADVAWMKPLKDKLRKRRTSTEPWKMAPPSRSTIVEWLQDVWTGLSRSTIINGFAKCGFCPKAAPTSTNTVDDDVDVSTNVVQALESVGAIDSGIRELADSMDVINMNADDCILNIQTCNPGDTVELTPIGATILLILGMSIATPRKLLNMQRSNDK
ncbi:TPA: hypothetical protein N0F65_006170, partial [Lagenidium giganteum]